MSALVFGLEHSAETLNGAVHTRTWRAVPRSGDTRPPLEHSVQGIVAVPPSISTWIHRAGNSAEW